MRRKVATSANRYCRRFYPLVRLHPSTMTNGITCPWGSPSVLAPRLRQCGDDDDGIRTTGSLFNCTKVMVNALPPPVRSRSCSACGLGQLPLDSVGAAPSSILLTSGATLAAAITTKLPLAFPSSMVRHSNPDPTSRDPACERQVD